MKKLAEEPPRVGCLGFFGEKSIANSRQQSSKKAEKSKANSRQQSSSKKEKSKANSRQRGRELQQQQQKEKQQPKSCLLYTSPSPRDSTSS
eukprot:450007-Prorocentrum_lima.AAC.1